MVRTALRIGGRGARVASRPGIVRAPRFSLAEQLIADEDEAIALSFNDDFYLADTGLPGSARVKSAASPSLEYSGTPYELLSYSSTPTPKLTRQADGVLRRQAHNLYLNSAAPANQSITVVSGATYAITITGSVSITLSGAATGTVTAGTTEFTAATGTLTCGSTSGSGTVHVRRTPSVDTYLETAGSARFDLPYVWDEDGALLGIAPEISRTNYQLTNRNLSSVGSSGDTSITTTQNLTGADGQANKAWTVTATAANGRIDRFSLALSGIGQYHIRSFWAKRLVGSGPIYVPWNSRYGWVARGDETLDGVELLTNPSFATDLTGWTTTTAGASTVVQSSGSAVMTRGTGNCILFQTLSVPVGGAYMVTAVVSAASGGGCNFNGGSGQGIAISSAGTYSIVMMATIDGVTARFDVSTNGASVTIDSVSIQEITNIDLDISSQLSTEHWRRIDVPINDPNGLGFGLTFATSGDSIGIDFVQFESSSTLNLNARPTSPIETFASSITRAEDRFYIDDAEFPLSQTEGYLQARGQLPAGPLNDSNRAFASISNGTGNELVALRVVQSSGAKANLAIVDGGSTVATETAGSAFVADTPFAMGGAWAANDAQACSEQDLSSGDASVTLPTVDRLEIGRDASNAACDGIISEIVYIPRRLSNAEMQARNAA